MRRGPFGNIAPGWSTGGSSNPPPERHARFRYYTEGISAIGLFKGIPPAPNRQSETLMQFIGRAREERWDAVRAVVEEWFARLPKAHQAEMSSRLGALDDEQVIRAWWELYVHESFRRAGFAMTIHPELPGRSRRPDFLVDGFGSSFYLEAATAGPPRAFTMSERRRRRVCDAMQLNDDRFLLWLNIEREGMSSPSGVELRNQVQAWLRTLDREELASRMAAGLKLQDLPIRRIEVSDWEFTVRPIPRADHRMGHAPESSIGIGPNRIWYSSTQQRAFEALRAKAKRYGELHRPYLIALLFTDPFADEEDMAEALFGQVQVTLVPAGDGEWTSIPGRAPNGLWSNRRRSNISGVIMSRTLYPWNIGTVSPRYWPNPWARWPIGLERTSDWLAQTLVDDDGSLRFEPPTQLPHEFYDLPPAWPT